MKELKFALFGAGFWAPYQLSGWLELPGVTCAAICGANLQEAQALAHRFPAPAQDGQDILAGRRGAGKFPAAYADPEALIREIEPDFIDIVTNVETHRPLVEMAARHGIPVICQKPMAPTLADAVAMLETCKRAGVPLFIHENWRWQTAIRALKEHLDRGAIGTPFRARIDMISGFPVFINQPFFKDLEQFLLTDLGTHILDVARFLFGEPETLYCQTQQVHKDIKGEDVATVILRMKSGASVICEMAYAENYLEREHFPQTFIFIEGSAGSLELGPDFWIRETTAEGTLSKRYPPHHYSWADPAYDLVHSSIVSCHENILAALRGEGEAETTGEDNLRTLQMVFGAYDSERLGQAISIA